MKLRHLFLGALAVVGLMTACEQEVNLGTPKVALSENTMTFESAGGSQELTLTATRDWMVEKDSDWVVVSPESGSASTDEQKVTVTVLENKDLDREASVKFTIGMSSKTLKVIQAGPGGSAEALIVYSNDFDKEEAVKGDQWTTYLDTFTGWRNEKGTGIANVTYGFDRLTARTNSGNGSAGSYSIYAGSGSNYLWFGSGSPYFAVKNISLPEGKTNFTLSFGSERYEYNTSDNTFNFNEFKVYISADGKKWVRLSCQFAGGSMPDGLWDLASSTFTVPAGTKTLYIYFASTVPSAYALDDLSLVQASSAGTAVDFSTGESFEVGDSTAGGGTGGGGTDDGGGSTGGDLGKVDISAVIAAEDNSTVEVEALVVATYSRGILLKDDTGYLLVYEGSKAPAAVGDKVNVKGTKTTYAGLAQIGSPAVTVLTSGNAVTHPSPKVLDGAGMDAQLEAGEVEYIEYTGSLNVSGYYYNVNVAGASTAVGSLSYPAESLGLADLNGKEIKVTGYYIGVSGAKYVNTMVTAVEATGNPGSGSDDGGTETPPTGEEGEFDPQGVTWTLGTNAYDCTSEGTNAQTATVNGVAVSNLLKLGTGSKVGDATLHVPAGTAKIGFYCVAWNNRTAQAKFSVAGTELKTISPASNTGAAGIPPYTSITVTDSDYYEIEMPSKDAVDVKVETLDPANGRVLLIGLKAISE